jgi:hypothetical protein
MIDALIGFEITKLQITILTERNTSAGNKWIPLLLIAFFFSDLQRFIISSN